MSQFILGIGVGAILTIVYQTKSLNIAKWLYDHESYTDLKRVGVNKYEISYWYKGQEYKICFPIKSGPKKMIMSVKDENDDDVYDRMFPLLGPNRDFHRQKVTPRELGHRELHFIYVDGKVFNFGSDDVIVL
jgi:hypothetical protein